MTDPDPVEASSIGAWPLTGGLSVPLDANVPAGWYETWRTQYNAHRAAEEAQRSRMRREIRWMTGLIAAWSLVMGAAAAGAIWFVL